MTEEHVQPETHQCSTDPQEIISACGHKTVQLPPSPIVTLHRTTVYPGLLLICFIRLQVSVPIEFFVLMLCICVGLDLFLLIFFPFELRTAVTRKNIFLWY